MNSVERVKAICKERKLPISKLEKDLGFSNGYIGQLRKGTFPAERLIAIAEYLSVSTDYLLGKEPLTITELFTGNVKENKEYNQFVSELNNIKSPGEITLTEAEDLMLQLFRQIPEDKQPLAIELLRTALKMN